jgi:hypothetical protein
MTALIVYESMFGSTRTIAEAVAEGLTRADVPVRVVEVGELAGTPEGGGIPDDVTLLVVGGPTHAFSMTREQTRADAAKIATEQHTRLVSDRTGIREWLETVRLPQALPVAVFDTKVDKPMLPGSAAKAAARRLKALGGQQVVPPHSFRVLGKTEGLCAGEIAEARQWGRGLAAAAGVRS